MTSRERLIATLNHKQPDRVVLDIGATSQTGINAGVLYGLRKALGLEERPIKIQEPAQMLGIVEEDLRKALNVDVVGLWNPTNTLGVKNENWKPWTMPDGTPTLMAGDMAFSRDENYIYTYPQGDTSVPPSMNMPENGYFFDNIDRSDDYDEDNLNAVEDFKEDFGLFTDDTCRYLETEAKRLFDETEYGIIGMCGGGGFGDVFTLPACWRKSKPQGIRKLEDWLMAHVLHPDYILDLFELQLDFALKNLEMYRQAVGDRIQAVWISGTDFGTQNGTFASVEAYRTLYKPFHKRVNDWVHQNTDWKVFYHTCGAIIPLMEDFHEAGIDILNPIQCSATGMDPAALKETYGDKFTFWGGGVDVQQVLPYGTPEQVKAQVKERLAIFSKGGGYIFNGIHNIVGKTPVENVVAMLEAFDEFVAENGA